MPDPIDVEKTGRLCLGLPPTDAKPEPRATHVKTTVTTTVATVSEKYLGDRLLGRALPDKIDSESKTEIKEGEFHPTNAELNSPPLQW